ncbi:hypothetical protein SAY86_006462 [Trapa natans]|uniref:Uncharacterized protein n=1 Tax=Trapa natans TaxID=22666 RepID=A0AAN7L7D7_TRANT|nr:hypothetical protein SAY86_006462 [Trapa natans]
MCFAAKSKLSGGGRLPASFVFPGKAQSSRLCCIAQSIDTPTLAELVSKKQHWFARSRKELRLSHSLDLNFRVMHSLICRRKSLLRKKSEKEAAEVVVGKKSCPPPPFLRTNFSEEGNPGTERLRTGGRGYQRLQQDPRPRAHLPSSSRNPGRPAGVDSLPSGFSLNGLEYLKLLYNSIVHGHRLHDPPWKRQSVQYREIRGRIKALTAKIQELKKRVASGETGRDVVDYYALMGLQRSWLKAGAPTGPPTADPQAQARQGPGWSSWRFRGRQR